MLISSWYNIIVRLIKKGEMEMVRYTDAQVITAELGQALRQADSLVFHYKNGQSYIRCLKENVGVWKETKEIRIDCGTVLHNYGSRHGLGDVRSASCVINNVQYYHHIQTTLKRVKKGDRLALKWLANNNNQYLERAGLYRDELYLIIEKPNGKLEEYFLAVSVCENNTAKMVKNETTPMSVVGE